jgi:hypothetical protein
MERNPPMKKFIRRATLIQVILRVGILSLRLLKLVLEILDKVANCDDRKLQRKISVAWQVRLRP